MDNNIKVEIIDDDSLIYELIREELEMLKEVLENTVIQKDNIKILKK